MFEPNLSDYASMGLCVEESLVTLDSDDCVLVPVQNYGSECICLKKGLEIRTYELYQVS